MRAGVARRQRLAEVIRWLLAHDPHLRREVCIVLLLLDKINTTETIRTQQNL